MKGSVTVKSLLNFLSSSKTLVLPSTALVDITHWCHSLPFLASRFPPTQKPFTESSGFVIVGFPPIVTDGPLMQAVARYAAEIMARTCNCSIAHRITLERTEEIAKVRFPLGKNEWDRMSLTFNNI